MKRLIKIWLFLASLLALVGCKNIAYNTVNKDFEPSERNKQILNSVCSRTYPVPPPVYIEGKTIVKKDTFSKTDTFTVVQDSLVTKYVYKTNTVTIERTKTDTLRVTDQYKESALNAKIKSLETEHIKDTVLLSEVKSKLRIFQLLVYGSLSISIILILIKTYGTIRKINPFH